MRFGHEISLAALLLSAERNFETGPETQGQCWETEYRIVVLAGKVLYHGKKSEMRVDAVTAAEVNFLPRGSKIAIRQQQRVAAIDIGVRKERGIVRA